MMVFVIKVHDNQETENDIERKPFFQGGMI